MSAFNDLKKGSVLKRRYKIERVLGSGHSSVVYEAVDMRSDTLVAIKVMDPLLNLDSTIQERFLREVQILQPINHPNIIQVYDAFETQGWRCISMEIAPGRDGKEYISQSGPMPFTVFLKTMDQLLDALAACHDKGVVHRDVKPQNIAIDAEHHVKLLDFGIAKMAAMSDLTKTGTSLGTPEYMAPEIFRKGASFDPRIDIYAVGLVMHEFLSGKSLFQAKTLNALFQLHQTGDRAPVTEMRPDLPDWIDSIIAKCLEPDPAERYQSIIELQSDINKSKMASAHLQRQAEPALCSNCRAKLFAHTPFCCQCGAFAEVKLTPGEYSLIIQECGEHWRLAKFLEKTHKKVSAKEVEKSLEKPPVLVAKNVSKETAERLAADLSLFPCRSLVTNRLSQSFKLPDYYAAIAFVLPLILIMFSGAKANALLTAGLVLLALEAAAFAMYMRKTRPLINIGIQGAGQPPPPKALEYAERIKGLSTPRFRSAMGNLFSKYFRIHKKVSRMTGGELEAEALDRVMGLALDSLKTAEEYMQALSSTSIAELKEREFRLTTQIEMAKNVETTDKLIKAKAECLSQVTMYREMEDKYHNLFTSVTQANGALQRYEDSLMDASEEGMINALVEKMNHALVIDGDFH
ncbi:serine/threonine protein kinase [Desulfatibacillum aliphaticivorans]|uniref:Serine/threonine protein kinase n=1 Tax=Desulfatibacillum aliphaticivorans TaxID=218208 RepID=B8FGQ4_DESAL|nr:serine/threonine-protein kinase [Desulfatibacillum aliphaticivorans]ACL05284.1 serine/threonine protein kinase [Desulfatibacillum aliphaticivorans]